MRHTPQLDSTIHVRTDTQSEPIRSIRMAPAKTSLSRACRAGPARNQVGLRRAIAADGSACRQPWRASASMREDLDHAAQRIRAVEARGRTPQHLDPIDLRQTERFELGLAEGRRADPDTVDDDQGAARTPTPKEKATTLHGPPLRASCIPAWRRRRSSTESAVLLRIVSASMTTISATLCRIGRASRLPVTMTGSS